MSKFVVGDKLLHALYEEGILGEDYTYVRRLVIDLTVGEPARIFFEKFADDEQLVSALTAGLEIVETSSEAGVTRGAALPGKRRR